MRRPWRYLARAGASALAAFLVTALLLTVTGRGQRALLDIAAWTASSGELSIDIGRLEGSLFSDGKIARLTLSDAKGVWAELNDIAFAWTPWSLASGTLDIARLRIAKATISRRPADDTRPDDRNGSRDAGGAFPILPLRIGSLAIDQAFLADTVLGERARLSVNGALHAEGAGGPRSGSIVLADLDRAAFVKAGARYRADTGILEVKAEAEEDDHGVLSSLLGIEDAGGLRLVVNGAGPIGAWRGDWSLAAGGGRIAGGLLRLQSDPTGLRLAAEADGEIGRFAPKPYAAILSGSAHLVLQASMLGKDDYRLDKFQLDAPQVAATASGALDLKANRLSGEGQVTLRGVGGNPVALIFADDSRLELEGATASFAARPGPDGVALSGRVDAVRPAFRGNRAEKVAIQFSARLPDGAAALMDRLDAVVLSAAIDRPVLADPALAPMAGNTVTSRLAGSKSGRRLTIADLTLTAAGGTATAKGGLSVDGFDGAVALSIPDAQVLSRLLGRELDGQLSMTASGKASFDGSLEMAVKGRADGIAAGTDLLGQLVAGQSGIEGKIARDGQGALRFQSLSLQTHALSAQLDGRLGPDGSDAKLSGRIADLARVLPESSGALAVELTIAGRGAARHIAARLSATEATVRGAPLRDVVVSYQGRGDRASQDGTLSAAGGIGEARLTGAGQLAYGGVQGLTIRDLKLALGENRMEANITLPPAGDARGAASLTIANAGQLAPILGIALEGSASIDAQLQGMAEAPGITAVAHSDRFRVGTIQVEGGVAELDIANALKQPVISGIVQARGLSAGERRITALTLNATPQADRTALTVSAVIDGQWRVAGAALADFTDWQPNVSLHDVSVRTGATVLAQEGTAQLSSAGRSLRVDHLVLATGKGRIAATIEAGETLTGKIEIRRFPAQFGGLFTPGIEPAGIIDGTVELAGEAAAPEIGYRLSWQEASLTGRLPPGFPSLDLKASGALRGDDLQIDAAASGPGGLSLKATGALRGVRAATKFDLKAAGTVPLSLADAFLASRGTHLDGRAAIDLTVSGQAAKPVIEGRVTASGAAVTDPATGIALKDARLTARLAGGVLHIETLDARSEQGASLAASGTLGILGSKALPADLRIKANALRFNDQRVVTGEISGDVTLKGDLNGQSAVSGGFDVARLDIQIPRSMPASVEALDLQHKNAPDYIAAAQRARQSGEASSLPSTIKLALTLNSANRIFVTGRGLDAQLGGALQLLGSADTPRAIGAFTLERGKLALLGRSLEFTSGTINFGGDLDPVLAFLAVVEMSGMRIEVRVSGQASDPKFAFSSNPELPEDEIVALLLFNKSIGELSPLQIAQLASEVSELGGLSSGPGLLGQLKSAVGIDTLNMTTDAKGDAVFSAGSYLSDKVFVGVEQGTSGASSRVKVDLGITKHLKLRGETDADGKSKLGVGVEWEY